MVSRQSGSCFAQARDVGAEPIEVGQHVNGGAGLTVDDNPPHLAEQVGTERNPEQPDAGLVFDGRLQREAAARLAGPGCRERPCREIAIGCAEAGARIAGADEVGERGLALRQQVRRFARLTPRCRFARALPALQEGRSGGLSRSSIEGNGEAERPSP